MKAYCTVKLDDDQGIIQRLPDWKGLAHKGEKRLLVDANSLVCNKTNRLQEMRDRLDHV